MLGVLSTVGLATAAALVAPLHGSVPIGDVSAGNARARRAADNSAAALAFAFDLARTRPPGRGRAFRLAPRGAAVTLARPVMGLRCARRSLAPYGAHVELFAANRALAVPAGIGWAPPVSLARGRVSGGRCAYPLHTDDPSGLVMVQVARAAATPTVGALFALWGQRLDAHHLAGFASASSVHAFLDGRPWRRDPRTLPLHRHAQVELEIGPAIAPHPGYAFPAGL